MQGFIFLNPGTRFRPLSLELPQALFPIAGVPLLEHHIDACAAVRAIILAEHSAHTCTCSCFFNAKFCDTAVFSEGDTADWVLPAVQGDG